MATFPAGISSLGLGNLTVDPASVKREVALLLGGHVNQDSVSLSQGLSEGGSEVNSQPSYGPGDGHQSGDSNGSVAYATESVNVVSTRGDIGDCGGGSANWIGINNGTGQAAVDLGNYTLQFDKSDSAITLTVKATGDTTTINGDPHVTDNGQTFTFKNNTTFQLSDGTDMTIKTVPAGNGQTLSDEVDLSKGAISMTVTGLASSDANALTISAGLNGWGLRAANASDPTIYQTADQWNTSGGAAVDQNYANLNL